MRDSEKLQTDPHRWTEFVREVYPLLIHRAYVMTRDRELAKDLVQQAFVHFIERPFEEYAHPQAYIVAIVLNLARSHYRSSARRVLLEAAHDVDSLAAPDSEEWMAWDAQRTRLLLAPKDRDLFDLLAEGLDTREVAARLGIEYSRAAVRIHRLHKRLRKLNDAEV